ncbi:MAG: hypothetical protein AAGG55_13260 [Pseudomonadota bacterium]
MSDLHKYLYAFAAACFIGVGSGFLTFMPYLFNREAEVITVVTAHEQRVGVEFGDGFECELGAEHYAECQYANYMARSNSTLAGFCQKLAYFLIGAGAFSAVIGFQFHRREAPSGHAT